MSSYSTSQIAKQTGIHPNTVRFYEEIGFLPPVPRRKNGYRVYSEQHLAQIRLIRTALRCEILHGDLRKMLIEIIRLAAGDDLEGALRHADCYWKRLATVTEQAEEAAELAAHLLQRTQRCPVGRALTRSQAAAELGVSIDVLRNWERNGLVEVPRKVNGYRIYTDDELDTLKIIRTLRRADYSMMAILRMFSHIRQGGGSGVRQLLDTPGPAEDVVTATDRFLSSLAEARQDATEIARQLEAMQAE